MHKDKKDIVNKKKVCLKSRITRLTGSERESFRCVSSVASDQLRKSPKGEVGGSVVVFPRSSVKTHISFGDKQTATAVSGDFQALCCVNDLFIGH